MVLGIPMATPNNTQSPKLHADMLEDHVIQENEPGLGVYKTCTLITKLSPSPSPSI